MVVVHIITGLGIGGAEIMLQKLLRGAMGNGTRHIVFVLSAEESLAGAVRETGAEVVLLRLKKGAGVLRALWQVRQRIRKERASVVMTWLHHADLFGSFLKCLCPALPLIWNIRCSKLELGVLPRRNLQIVRWLSWLSWIPAVIVANSSAGMREHVAVGYRTKGWQVLPNGFDTEVMQPDPAGACRLRQEFGIGAETFLIGLVARYHPMKGFDLFIEAAAKVAAASERARFMMVGSQVDTENQSLMGLIDAAGIRDRVILTGPRKDIPQIMSMLDVMVLSSNSEGFPNVVGEAMACGTPCVVTDVGDCAHLVADTGRVVPSGDAEALAEAVLEVMDLSPGDFQTLQEKARARICEHYTLDAIVRDYHDLFRQVQSR